jgi:hypothetical protein
MTTWTKSGLWLACALALAACDPVQDSKVASLGDEAPGVRKGPTHRPGQPCTWCHDGALFDPPAFSIAGTVFESPSNLVGVNGATITMTDSSGDTFQTTSNQVGNFYVTPDQWTPKFPIPTTVVTYQQRKLTMYSQIGWSSSCAECHEEAVGPSSPGPVVLRLDDGGAPP